MRRGRQAGRLARGRLSEQRACHLPCHPPWPPLCSSPRGGVKRMGPVYPDLFVRQLYHGINTTSGLASRAHYLTSGSKSPYLRGERVGTAQRVLVRGQAPGPWRTARIRGRTRRPTARRLLQARVNVWEGQRLHRHRCASAGIQGAKVTTRIARHSGQELLTRGWILSSQPLHKA